MKTYSCGLNWFGPFTTPQQVKEWEESNGNDTYLYLIRGKKKVRNKKVHAYYCGQAYKQSAGKRIRNKHHHIEEVAQAADHLCIYVAKFDGIVPTKKLLDVVENLFISFLFQHLVKEPDTMLNKQRFYKPTNNCYVVNNWFSPSMKEILRYKKDSFCKLIPDTICYYAETGAIYGASKIKHIVDLD